MGKIDVDKFISSAFKSGRFDSKILEAFQECLADQGLTCIDGSITDIVEDSAPKFKIGTWIIDENGNTVQVLGFKNHTYRLSNGHADESFEENWRAWQIYDAQSGDILSTHGLPFIYNGKIDDKHWTVGSYGGIVTDDHTFDIPKNDIEWASIEDVKPATKGECEWLRTEMDASGFTIVGTANGKHKVVEICTMAKFNVGDWIVPNNGGHASRITGMDYSGYFLSNGYLGFSSANAYHLWTIKDANDGDILADDNGWTCIFKHMDDDEHFTSHVFMDNTDMSICDGCSGHYAKGLGCPPLRPATTEEAKYFIERMHADGMWFDDVHKVVGRLKFGRGDYMMSKGTCLKVVGLNENSYVVEDSDGKESTIDFKDQGAWDPCNSPFVKRLSKVVKGISKEDSNAINEFSKIPEIIESSVKDIKMALNDLTEKINDLMCGVAGNGKD